MPSPKRTILARVAGSGARFTVASLALPPWTLRRWNQGDQRRQGDRIAGWLERRGAPVVVGMDRNGPRHERLDGVEWGPGASMRLLGAQARHDLRDVFLDHLDQRPGELDTIRCVRPDGPLAISYQRSRDPENASRYDVIMASPEFSVQKAGYEWDGAVAAGSDHGLVWADLQLHPPHR